MFVEPLLCGRCFMYYNSFQPHRILCVRILRFRKVYAIYLSYIERSRAGI